MTRLRPIYGRSDLCRRLRSCGWSTSTNCGSHVDLFFFACCNPRRASHAAATDAVCTPVVPLFGTKAHRPRAFQDFAAAPCLCFASRLPSRRPKLFGQFHARTRAPIALLTAFVFVRMASKPIPGLAIHRYPAVTREAALSRSAARHPLFAAAARLYSQRHPPSSVSGSARRRERYPVSREGSI